MFLGNIGTKQFDIRVRISSNGKAELVAKQGEFHRDDRIEVAQEIRKDQMIGFAKILSLFGFSSKVTERENYTFDLGNNITLVLVRAGSIAYVEIEKIAGPETIDSYRKEIIEAMAPYGLHFIEDEAEFSELCDRLTKKSDWILDNSEEAIRRLEDLIAGY